jgi:hypothetical protein
VTKNPEPGTRAGMSITSGYIIEKHEGTLALPEEKREHPSQAFSIPSLLQFF